MNNSSTRPKGFNQNAQVALLNKRLSDMLTFGEVVEVDHDAGKYRVRIGSEEPMPDEKEGKADVLSFWVPQAVSRAGKNRSWEAHELGDQVAVLSPNGDITNGFIFCSINKEGHAPHAALDPEISRWAYGEDKELINAIVNEIDRRQKHVRTHLPEGGRFFVTIGKEMAPGACIEGTIDQISLRVKNTSIAVYEDRIELQVDGAATAIRLSKSEIIALIKGASFVKLDQTSINAQVAEAAQLKITQDAILLRVEKTIQELTASSIISELVNQQVKSILDAQGISLNTANTSAVISSSGYVTLTSNGAALDMTGSVVTLQGTSYDWFSMPASPVTYPAGQAPDPSAAPAINAYVPKSWPAMIPGNDPYIPATDPAIHS